MTHTTGLRTLCMYGPKRLSAAFAILFSKVSSPGHLLPSSSFVSYMVSSQNDHLGRPPFLLPGGIHEWVTAGHLSSGILITCPNTIYYEYTDVSSEHCYGQMICHIHHMNMDAHHCVCVDVATDDNSVWMICHTHHIHMDAHHCVCVDVLLDYTSNWMIYDTYHRHMDVFHYVHFDGSSDDFEGTKNYDRHHRRKVAPHHVRVGLDVHSR
jgi:hypothetical protein